ncbi:hypothetical protein ABNG02_15185 [Halorubrum ejinorense]|uniref:TFIIB-type zinc ribbon-containing protein n=1 Tax=Halorubrum ejinorense TaxID=425309 RepID=A0AAV3SRS2_9EURY
MKVRGERECQSCETRWSYYKTGSVACPSCGDLRSVGVDDRTVHTDAAVTLDLSGHRDRVGDARGTLPDSGVDDLQSDLREYCRKRGFVDGGRLAPLDGTYLAARELLEAVDCFERLRDPTDVDREYLLALLAGAEAGDRPATADVPEALREARGMAAVRAVEAYRTDALDFLDELESSADRADTSGEASHKTSREAEESAGDDGDAAPTVTAEGSDPEARVGPARDALEGLRDRVTRVDALGGDVPPTAADALVEAADAIGTYVRTGDEAALATAEDLIADATVDDFDSPSE